MQWEGSNWHPLLARVKSLPLKMGFEETDNNTDEVTAVSLAEEMLPPGLGTIIFADSTTWDVIAKSANCSVIAESTTYVVITEFTNWVVI